MTPQTPYNPITSPNLNDKGKVGINLPLNHKRACKGFNKRGAIPLFVIATTLILIVIGVVSLVIVNKGISEEDVKKLIDSVPKGDIVQPDEKRDNADSTSEKEADVVNTPPPVYTTPVCSYTGKFTDVWIKQRTTIDNSAKDIFGTSPRAKAYAIYQYTGNCVTDVYLEMGIIPQSKAPLSVMPIVSTYVKSRPSACDGNVNYYGEWYRQVKPNQKLLVIQFSPETPNAEGTYATNIGAYTGCASKERDTTITELHKSIKISDTYSENIAGSASESWDKII